MNDKTKLKYFDQLVNALEILCAEIDEECPYEFRTDSLSEAIGEGYEVLRKVYEENEINNSNAEKNKG